MLYKLARMQRNVVSVGRCLQLGSLAPIFKRLWNILVGRMIGKLFSKLMMR